jgi:phage-related protein
MSRRNNRHGNQDHPVLHCFQKKSKSGIATPKPDLDLINTRLKAAKQDFEVWQAQQGARK